MRRRFVAQFSIVTGEPKLFNQSNLGQQLRLRENELRKNLVVKEIQTPWPEPNQIDQKNSDHDHSNEHQSEDPLQHALKHDSPQPREPLAVNEKLLATSK